MADTLRNEAEIVNLLLDPWQKYNSHEARAGVASLSTCQCVTDPMMLRGAKVQSERNTGKPCHWRMMRMKRAGETLSSARLAQGFCGTKVQYREQLVYIMILDGLTLGSEINICRFQVSPVQSSPYDRCINRSYRGHHLRSAPACCWPNFVVAAASTSSSIS